MPKEKRNEMFPWEKPHEYDYRNTTGKISAEISTVLQRIGEIAASGNLDFSELRDIMGKCQRKVKMMTPPSMYEESHRFLLEAANSYSRAMEILTEAGKAADKDGMFKAGRLVEEGNSFTQITKSRIWEAIEKRNTKAG